MEDKQAEKILEPLKQVGLKDHERQRVRSALMSYMRAHPVQTGVLATVASFFGGTNSSYRFRPAFALSLVVVFLGTGTSLAAEMSLPGQALYAIKLQVNERVMSSLAFSPEAKIEFNASLADRRLYEAEELIARGTFSPESVEVLHANFEAANLAFETAVTDAAGEKSLAKLAEARSNLQASLQAHAQVLEALEVEPEGQGSQDVARLIGAVQSRAKDIAVARTRVERSIATTSQEDLADITEKKEDAKRAAEKLRKLAENARENFGEETSQEITAGAMLADQRIVAGTSRLESGDYGGALAAFQAAIRASKETKIGLEAAQNVKGKLRTQKKSRASEKAIQVAAFSAEAPAESSMMMQAAAPLDMAMGISPAAASSMTSPEMNADTEQRKSRASDQKFEEDHDESEEEHEDEDDIRVDLRF
jgi:tetratricopeptide (TPR) repeat protein